MKVLAELSAIVKIAFVCVVVGFVLGLCASGAVASLVAADTVSAISVAVRQSVY